MKRILSYLATALIFVIIGYEVGSFRTLLQTSRGLNSSELIWLTAIHQMISKGDYERAKSTIEMAVDAHAATLSLIQYHPNSLLVWMLPWAPNPAKQVVPAALKQANDYFVEKTTLLKPETRAYLASTQKQK